MKMTLAQIDQARDGYVHIGDYRIKIERDEDSGNSREWDNLTTMYCRHAKYNLGDKQIPESYTDSESGDEVEIDSQESFEAWVLHDECEKILAIRPLTLYDHSGLVMHIGTPTDTWDSMLVGWIVVTEKQAEDCVLTDRSEKSLLKIMKQEVEIYNQDLSGDVWGYIVEKGEKCGSCGHTKYTEVDSVWGFYDDESLLEAINSNLEE